MGYHIQYEETIIKTAIKTQPLKRSGKLTFVFVLVCIMVLSFILHRNKDVLMQYVLPGDTKVTAVALNTLAEDLKEGESIHDAITAFCREIIDHANIPG